MICIVDYGMGNLRSINAKLRSKGFKSIVSSNPNEINKADKLIIPGVGHFGEAMKNLETRNLIGVLNKKVLEDKTPVLGICLGMQLFMEYSEEGNSSGLEWIKGSVLKFNFAKEKQLKVPHVGWNEVDFTSASVLFNNFEDRHRFYFTHSYYVKLNEEIKNSFYTDYGRIFVSSFEKDNIFAVQFHPEKSHKTGFNVIINFLNI